MAALIAGRPTTTHTCQHPPAPHVVIIRDLTILVLWRAALMLAMQVGRQPCLLRTPQLGCSGQFSCLVALRVLFLTRAIWISDYSADARRCSGLYTAVERLRCCVFGRCIHVACFISQPLALGRLSRFGPIMDSGVGGADKGFFGDGPSICQTCES